MTIRKMAEDCSANNKEHYESVEATRNVAQYAEEESIEWPWDGVHSQLDPLCVLQPMKPI